MIDRNKPWLPDPSTWKGTWREDWRIMGQEGYLNDKILERCDKEKIHIISEEYQCEFCRTTINSDKYESSCAYYEKTTHCWICEQCYEDFKYHFKWDIDEHTIK